MNQSQNNSQSDSEFAAKNALKADMYDTYPDQLSDEELAGKKALVKTEKGDFTIEFFSDVAPLTVSNFIFLANEDFYDNLVIHRREEKFVVQTGDPLGEDPALKGTGGPGYTVPAEISTKSHTRGIVATARTGDQVNPSRASSGSQFYITLDDATFLDNAYTIFGQVNEEGMNVVDTLRVGDRILDVIIE